MNVTPEIACRSAWPWVEPDPGFPKVPAGLAPQPGAPVVNWPKISVVTPNYNYGHLIERTIRSVLAQGYPNLEYIVIDDGSTDDSISIIRKYESRLAHWEHHSNCGQYKSVNKGFSLASGDVFVWLDSDDIQLPWTLWCVGAIFARFPQVQWIVGQPAVFYDGIVHHVTPLKPFPREFIRAGLYYGYLPGGLGWISQENLFWRRSLWEKAGPLRTQLTVGADYDMNVRFAEHAELYAVSTLLGGFGVRPGQNRSTVERAQYEADISRVLGELRDKGRTLPDVRFYQQFRHVRGVRGLVSRMLSMKRYRGPVLQWDFNAAQYCIKYQPFFG
jgi:glycosyltransferase involved in cell wall biosynthesis